MRFHMHTPKFRKSVGLAAGLLPILASVAFAPAAWAGHFNLYQHDNYGGSVATFYGTDYELNNKYWNNTTTIMNSQASSMRNYSSRAVGMWDIGGSCTGPNYVARANSVDSTFANNSFNDKASCVIFL